MHRLLHRTYKAVQELNPIDVESPDADRKMLKVARRYSNKIVEIVNELCETSNLSDKADDLPLEAPDITSKDLVKKHVVAICDAIEMIKFVAGLAEPPTKQQTFQIAEDKGLVQLLRGYNFFEHNTPAKMHHTLYPYSQSKGLFADSIDAEKEADITARLQCCEDVMAYIQAQGAVDVVINGVNTGIMMVRFMTDWRKMLKKKKWKGEYRRQLFSKIYPNSHKTKLRSRVSQTATKGDGSSKYVYEIVDMK